MPLGLNNGCWAWSRSGSLRSFGLLNIKNDNVSFLVCLVLVLESNKKKEANAANLKLVEWKEWDCWDDYSFVFCSFCVQSWHHSRLDLDDSSFLFSLKDQICSSAVNLQESSHQWASCYVIINLIIENLCPAFTYKLTAYSLWQQVVSFCHTATVLIIYKQQHIYLKPNHCLSLNLSDPDANEASFWLTAPHKLITTHNLHYSTIRLSIIL